MVESLKKLHLGCGTNFHEDWINLDGSWNAWLSQNIILRKLIMAFNLLPKHAYLIDWPVKIVIHDVRKRLPFQDCTMDAIYASHLWEHLYLEEALKLFKECHRTLKPAGVLRIVVPDLQSLATEYVDAKLAMKNNDEILDICPADKLNEKLLLRNRSVPSGNILYRIYCLCKDFHSHKWVYDEASLAKYFILSGFRDVRKMQAHESRINGIDKIENLQSIINGVGICVEGIK